ncbi:MAG: Dyp-type peroxidase [Armatimonadetes bacterium]|nr:Dyp-type peroxidase [Armatimonadota bacterium]
MAEPAAPNLANIQGNILGGFNKDFQSFLFLHFSDRDKGRAWLEHMAPEIATSEEVVAFNTLFKQANRRRGHEYGILKATWTNIAFTASGLKALGVPDAEIATFSEAFRQGMKARAATPFPTPPFPPASLGDEGDSDPSHWIAPLGSKDVHAILHVASDSHADLHATVARYVQNLDFNGTVKRLFTQEGIVRQDEPGHEHFGFKDGVSQPGIRGVDLPRPGGNPNEGNPGQDLLWPGEFVLGYPTQIDGPDTVNTPPVVPNPNPGPVSKSGPPWAADGSYLVFRRLRQDVAGFHAQLHQLAPANGLDPRVFAAKLVGRYHSGCPLEPLKGQPQGHDAPDDPAVGADSLRNNNFEYGGDPAGNAVPRASHIRKTYPRDEDTPGGGENNTQKRRLLRRGVPFGLSLNLNAPAPHDSGDRGLLFLCYQSSIEEQFEFVQKIWVNNSGFPQGGDGEDPIIAQSKTGLFACPGANPANIPALKHFVTTTGGDYFFQPSISALYHIAGVPQPLGA